MEEPDENWWRASRRIVSDTVSAAEITARLRIFPTRASETGPRGAQRPDAHGAEDVRVVSRQRAVRKGSLDEQIVALLDLIEPSAAELRALRDEGCTIECFTMFASTSGQGGITLDVTVLRRMAALGVDLSLDLYPPEERS